MLPLPQRRDQGVVAPTIGACSRRWGATRMLRTAFASPATHASADIPRKRMSGGGDAMSAKCASDMPPLLVRSAGLSPFEDAIDVARRAPVLVRQIRHSNQAARVDLDEPSSDALVMRFKKHSPFATSICLRGRDTPRNHCCDTSAPDPGGRFRWLGQAACRAKGGQGMQDSSARSGRGPVKIRRQAVTNRADPVGLLQWQPLAIRNRNHRKTRPPPIGARRGPGSRGVRAAW